MSVVYLDNAASSWPKPPEVKQAMVEALEEYAANPGRGGHKLAMQASRVVFQTRFKLAKLFGISNPNDVVFTSNATSALNQGIRGLLKQGDHVVTTAYEHNSVRRPLEYLKKTIGIKISYISPRDSYCIDYQDVEQAIQSNTTLVVVSHASNLMGAIAPIQEIGSICSDRHIPFMVDASQSAGIIPIDVQRMNISLLAFPGHKGLYGPQGTGGLYIHPDLDLEPLVFGGTGSHSESIEQPKTRPDRYESGTLNTVGIAGLGAGVDFVLREGVDVIRRKEQELVLWLLEELEKVEEVTIYGPPRSIERVAVVAFGIKGMDASEVAFILDHNYHIAVRAGYHCTPLAHEVMGTLGQGAVRVSIGYFNNNEDIDTLIMAVRDIVKENRK